MKALIQLKNCGYNYHLKDGTILLEEDCEAGKFINEVTLEKLSNGRLTWRT